MNYADVPKGLEENVRFRQHLVLECSRSPALARAVKEVCANDLLFWMNTFCWTFDPRLASGERIIPFVTYRFQDDTLLLLQERLGKSDVVVKKSRAMGATWLILALFTHEWQFRPICTFGLISSTEALVDKPGDPKSLFWKVDFLLEKQPGFLVPEFHRQKLHLLNKVTKSSMDGFATTGDIMRGDRRTAALIDEHAAFELRDGYESLAATFSATNCRFFNSTYKGPMGAFYDIAKDDSDFEKVSMPWWEHPDYAQGLYWKDGKRRSPWYDKECKRLVLASLAASELDMDPEGSVGPVCPQELLNRLEKQCMKPFMRGQLIHDQGENPRFLEDPDGVLRLWVHLLDGRPAWHEKYAIGCDVSGGSHTTNSVASVLNLRTGDKVAEVAVASLPPEQFADYCLALARWFNDAELIWELQGPGGTFGKRIIALGYRNVYFRQNEQSIDRKIVEGLIPGFAQTLQNKHTLILTYIAALGAGKFVNRCIEAVRELRVWSYGPHGYAENPQVKMTMDGSTARENHGDRVIADALANKLMENDPCREVEETIVPPSPNCMAARSLRHQQEQASKREWSAPVRPWQSGRVPLPR